MHRISVGRSRKRKDPLLGGIVGVSSREPRRVLTVAVRKSRKRAAIFFASVRAKFGSCAPSMAVGDIEEEC
jgi:hypothetical protein